MSLHLLEGHRPTSQEQDRIPGKFRPGDSDLVHGNDQGQMAPGSVGRGMESWLKCTVTPLGMTRKVREHDAQ